MPSETVLMWRHTTSRYQKRPDTTLDCRRRPQGSQCLLQSCAIVSYLPSQIFLPEGHAGEEDNALHPGPMKGLEGGSSSITVAKIFLVLVLCEDISQVGVEVLTDAPSRASLGLKTRLGGTCL